MMSESRQWAIWLRFESLLVFGAALSVYYINGFSWWIFLILFLVPDLSMLGYLAGRHVGAVSYNLVHAYIAPAMLLVYAMVTSEQMFLCYGIIWVAHIALDRALGFGLKSIGGFGHTHLGYVGKRKSV